MNYYYTYKVHTYRKPSISIFPYDWQQVREFGLVYLLNCNKASTYMTARTENRAIKLIKVKKMNANNCE